MCDGHLWFKWLKVGGFPLNCQFDPGTHPTNESERTLDLQPPGHKPLVVNGVVVGPFEEEEEGTGIASDVVKVEGAESGHPRSPDLRNDNGTAISPILGEQNKATHTPRATRGWTMTMCSLYMRQLGLLSNVQRRRNIRITTSSGKTH